MSPQLRPTAPPLYRRCRMYAFDVHCNAFFPMFLLLYVLQLVLSPVLLTHTFLSTALSTGEGQQGGRARVRQLPAGGSSTKSGNTQSSTFHSVGHLLASKFNRASMRQFQLPAES